MLRFRYQRPTIAKFFTEHFGKIVAVVPLAATFYSALFILGISIEIGLPFFSIISYSDYITSTLIWMTIAIPLTLFSITIIYAIYRIQFYYLHPKKRRNKIANLFFITGFLAFVFMAHFTENRILTYFAITFIPLFLIELFFMLFRRNWYDEFLIRNRGIVFAISMFIVSVVLVASLSRLFVSGLERTERGKYQIRMGDRVLESVRFILFHDHILYFDHENERFCIVRSDDSLEICSPKKFQLKKAFPNTKNPPQLSLGGFSFVGQSGRLHEPLKILAALRPLQSILD